MIEKEYDKKEYDKKEHFNLFSKKEGYCEMKILLACGVSLTRAVREVKKCLEDKTK